MIQCTFENGNKAFLRHVVVDMLIIDDGKILLVKRAPHLLEAGKYALVGGFVEQGETTEQAAIREAEEETGYIIKIERLLRFNDNPHRKGEDRQNISFIYIASPVKKISNSDLEVSEVKWFPLNALPPEEQIAFDHAEQIKIYLEDEAK